MSIEQTFEQFFKHEAKRSGQDFFSNDLVVLSNKSDTYIQAYIKGSTSCRVSLSSTSIESDTFTANCSCPTSNKGQLCKHIWGVLLSVEENYSDFLNSKVKIEKVSKESNPKQDAYKEKQSDYKKLQYQKQKLYAKKLKIEKDKKKYADSEPELPPAVESAYSYFLDNGFPMERPLSEEALNNARKKLSRVFHPDVGGSHEETVVLNKNYEILLSLIR